jgi:AraC-like DNA-binding protein
MATMVASVWDQRYHRLGGDYDSGFAHQLNLPEAQLTHIGWKPGIHIESGTPPGSIGFVQQLKGTGRMRINGRLVADDEVAIMHAPLDYDLVNTADTHYLVLAVDKERVRRHMEALWCRAIPDFNSISRLVSKSTAHYKTLELAFKGYLEQVYSEPGCISTLEAQHLLVEELLDTVVLSGRPSKSRRSTAKRHQLAQQAAGYLRENIDRVVTLRDMCEHVGVSERSLRQGFLERFGHTPTAYIKRHRLYQLHSGLKAGKVRDTTGTRTAMSLGLLHLGRTSSEYQVLFGELPSETLRRHEA